MRDLEQQFAAAAEFDGNVYLPNFTPSGPVDAVLIGMEPSLGRWARTPAEAASKIAAGFRNFMWSPEDFILHYAARRFLCSAGGTYHITDISKGAMTVKRAHIDRRARYARWAILLKDEIRLVAKPGAHIIAIGKAVYRFLERNGFDGGIVSIMHYSAQANAARNAAVVGARLNSAPSPRCYRCRTSSTWLRRSCGRTPSLPRCLRKPSSAYARPRSQSHSGSWPLSIRLCSHS